MIVEQHELKIRDARLPIGDAILQGLRLPDKRSSRDVQWACGKPLGETRAPNIGEQLSMLCLLAKKAKGPDFLSSFPPADLPGQAYADRQEREK